jgi:hypothetical protein
VLKPQEIEKARKRQESQDFGRGVTSEKFTEVEKGEALEACSFFGTVIRQLGREALFA